MSTFGIRVRELLEAHGRDASWLHVQTGIAHSTISNWFTKDDVTPKPSTVAKVAKAFGVEVDTLAQAANYVIRLSKDGDERARRRSALIEASPRWQRSIDRLARVSAHQQDVALSMLEAYLSTLPDQSLQESQ